MYTAITILVYCFLTIDKIIQYYYKNNYWVCKNAFTDLWSICRGEPVVLVDVQCAL